MCKTAWSSLEAAARDLLVRTEVMEVAAREEELETLRAIPSSLASSSRPRKVGERKDPLELLAPPSATARDKERASRTS